MTPINTAPAQLEFREDQVAAFAAFSGDLNPLHMDVRHARRSAYGERIVHGALVVGSALAEALTPEELGRICRVRAAFEQAVFLGRGYRLASEPAEKGLTLTVALGSMPVARVWVKFAEVQGWRQETRSQSSPAASRLPRSLSAEDIPSLGEESGRWVPGSVPCDFVRQSLPPGLTGLLGWISWLVGMRTPGQNALLAAFEFSTPRGGIVPPFDFIVDPPGFDARIDLVTLHAKVGQPDPAEVSVSAFLRSDAPVATVPALAIDRTPRPGATAVIVGGGSGLGAALAAEYALRGMRVLSCARGAQSHPKLPHDAATRIVTVRADAGTVTGLEAALRPQLHESISQLVLAASPPLQPLPFSCDTLAAFEDHVGKAVQLVATPLAVLANDLAPDASILVVSSVALDDPPQLWPHYVSAKAALEGLAAYWAATTSHHVFRVRPPRMWTRLTNGPAARFGAADVGMVAAAIATVMADHPPEEIGVVNPIVLPMLWEQAEKGTQ